MAWFREAFADQINPSWSNVHLDQLDQVCDKIEACVGPNKTQTRPKALASSGALPAGAKQQLYYQSMQSFFDNDEEAPESFLSFSQSLFKKDSTNPTELTSLLNNNNSSGCDRNDGGEGNVALGIDHTGEKYVSNTEGLNNFSPGTPTAASSLTLRAYLQRENSLALLHTAATPFHQLPPELQKLETFYSALFLAEIDQTTLFFKTMQSKVNNELLFLFAKSTDVMKAKLNIHTTAQLSSFLSTYPDHSLTRAYKLMQHYCEVLMFFDQNVGLRLTPQSPPLIVDQQLANFICGHAAADNNITIHSRTGSPIDTTSSDTSTKTNTSDSFKQNGNTPQHITKNTSNIYTNQNQNSKVIEKSNFSKTPPLSTPPQQQQQQQSRLLPSSQPMNDPNATTSPESPLSTISSLASPTPSDYSMDASLMSDSSMSSLSSNHIQLMGNTAMFKGHTIPLHSFPQSNAVPAVSVPINSTTTSNSSNNPTDTTTHSGQDLHSSLLSDAIKEDMAFIEVSFRELSRCLHLLTSYCKLNKSALLQSLERHDQTGTPLKLQHQMSAQVNKALISLHGTRWCRAMIAILVELYALFFNIEAKKAWKFLKSQAVVDKLKEPKTSNILSYFATSMLCTLLILILLYQYPDLHPWMLTILPLWRFSTFIVVFLLCLATMVYFCIRTNINYIFLLNLKPMTAYTHKSLFYHAGVLWAITTACMLFLIVFKLYDIHSIMFLPHTILTLSYGYYIYLNSDYLMSSLKQFVTCAPTFQSSFIGDQICSLTRLLGDVLYIIVFYIHCIFNLHRTSSLEHAQDTISRLTTSVGNYAIGNGLADTKTVINTTASVDGASIASAFAISSVDIGTTIANSTDTDGISTIGANIGAILSPSLLNSTEIISSMTSNSTLSNTASSLPTGVISATTTAAHRAIEHTAFLDQTLSMELQLEVRAIVKQCMWFITVMPFILRAIQCMRSYYHQKNFNPRHLGNTAKYLVAIVMSTFALLYKQALSFAPKLQNAAKVAGVAAGAAGAAVTTNKVVGDAVGKEVVNKGMIALPSFFSLFSFMLDSVDEATTDPTTSIITEHASVGAVGKIAGDAVQAAGNSYIVDKSIFEVYQIWLHQLQYIFLASAIITTLFQLVWDFCIDWGLFESGNYWPFRKKTIFRKNFLYSQKSTAASTKPKKPSTGSSSTPKKSSSQTSHDPNSSSDEVEVVTATLNTRPHSPSALKKLNNTIATVYTTAMIANTIMRLFWVETLLPWTSVGIFQGSAYASLFSTDFAVLILGIIEIVRRLLWAYFRLENNQVNNNAEYHPIHFKIPEANTGRQMLIGMANDVVSVNGLGNNSSLGSLTGIGNNNNNNTGDNMSTTMGYNNSTRNSLLSIVDEDPITTPSFGGLLRKNASLYRANSQVYDTASQSNGMYGFNNNNIHSETELFINPTLNSLRQSHTPQANSSSNPTNGTGAGYGFGGNGLASKGGKNGIGYGNNGQNSPRISNSNILPKVLPFNLSAPMLDENVQDDDMTDYDDGIEDKPLLNNNNNNNTNNNNTNNTNNNNNHNNNDNNYNHKKRILTPSAAQVNSNGIMINKSPSSRAVTNMNALFDNKSATTKNSKNIGDDGINLDGIL